MFRKARILTIIGATLMLGAAIPAASALDRNDRFAFELPAYKRIKRRPTDASGCARSRRATSRHGRF